MKDYDFITFGSATIDVFVFTDHNEVIKIMHPNFENELIAYPLGTKILIKDLEFHVGGGGTNSAVALAKLGLKVAFSGNIGNDVYGITIKQYLEKVGVDFIGNCKSKSGYSVILDSFVNDRTILTYKGANDLQMSLNGYAKALYCSALTGKAFENQESLFKIAKKRGMTIFYNPSSYIVEKGMLALKNLFKLVDYLIFNLEEARTLTRQTNIFKIFSVLMNSFSFKSVLITNGPEGVYFYYNNAIYHLDAHRVKVVETTGAGDAFGSTFAGMFIKTGDFVKSVKLGILNAESVIQKKGAKEGLLDYRILMRKFRKSKFNLKKIGVGSIFKSE